MELTSSLVFPEMLIILVFMRGIDLLVEKNYLNIAIVNAGQRLVVASYTRIESIQFDW